MMCHDEPEAVLLSSARPSVYLPSVSAGAWLNSSDDADGTLDQPEVSLALISSLFSKPGPSRTLPGNQSPPGHSLYCPSDAAITQNASLVSTPSSFIKPCFCQQPIRARQLGAGDIVLTSITVCCGIPGGLSCSLKDF